MTLPIMTAYAAVALAIIQIILTLAVGNNRRSARVVIGDNGDKELLFKIRRHANFIENAPIFLILLALLEIMGGPSIAVQAFAIVFPLARISHAFGMSPKAPLLPRVIGMTATLLCILGTAGTLVWHIQTL